MPLPIIEALTFPVRNRHNTFFAFIPGTVLLLLPGFNLFYLGYLSLWFQSFLVEEKEDFPSWGKLWVYLVQGWKVAGLLFGYFLIPIFLAVLALVPSGIGILRSQTWEQMLIKILGEAFLGIFLILITTFLFFTAWFFFPIGFIRYLEGGDWIHAFSFRQAWNDIKSCLPDYLASHIVFILCLFVVFTLIWIISGIVILLPNGWKMIPWVSFSLVSLGLTYSINVAGYLFAETYLGFLYSRLEIHESS